MWRGTARRRRNANMLHGPTISGKSNPNSIRPPASPLCIGPPESDACAPVAIVTVALPLPPAASITVAGEKLHIALTGKPEHASEMVDANPNFDVRLTVDVAVPPLVTVASSGIQRDSEGWRPPR